MMKKFTARAAVVVAATVIAAVTGSSAASAATVRPGAPADVPVLCASGSAWVKLFSATGERCYAGIGRAAVDLPAVTEMQIVGAHEVCLMISPLKTACYLTTRNMTVPFIPPAYVTTLDILR